MRGRVVRLARPVFYGNHRGSTSLNHRSWSRWAYLFGMSCLIYWQSDSESWPFFVSFKIQIQNHNGITKMITLTSLWISCSRDKGSSSSSLIITIALALYLRYFSSGWTPTRNLRSNTCLQKISEFPLKKYMPSQLCLLSFIFRVTAAISAIQYQDQLLCTITSIMSLFSFWSDLSLER